MPLSEPRIVLRLIKHRSRLDDTFGMKAYGSGSILAGTDTPPFSEPILCTYMDLDHLIETTNLSNIQRHVVDLFMRGYNAWDIAAMLETTPGDVKSHLIRAVDQLCKKSSECWREWVAKKDETVA